MSKKDGKVLRNFKDTSGVASRRGKSHPTIDPTIHSQLSNNLMHIMNKFTSKLSQFMGPWYITLHLKKKVYIIAEGSWGINLQYRDLCSLTGGEKDILGWHKWLWWEWSIMQKHPDDRAGRQFNSRGKKSQLPYFSLNAILTAWAIFYTKYLSSSGN